MAKPPPLDPATLFPRACTACGTPKARDDFATRGQGLIHRKCRACTTAAALQWQAANKDAHAEANARWLEKNRERETQKKRARYWEDPEAARERARKWAEANPEANSEAYKRWAAQNDDHLRKYRQEFHSANRETRNEQRREHGERWADETRPLAHHHREEWTGAQLEIADRRELNAKEAALLLGRTAAAVMQIRAKIDKRDPRTLSKLGYDPNKQED